MVTTAEDSSCSDIDEDSVWQTQPTDEDTLPSDTLAAASPFVPTGYQIETECPFEHDTPSPHELNGLRGGTTVLLHAFVGSGSDQATDWYIGKFHKILTEETISQRDRPDQGPMPNCVLSYTAGQKQHASCSGKLVGHIATGLYGHNYGPDEWWVLLRKEV